MRLLPAIEAAISSDGRQVWLTCVLVATTLFILASITDATGLRTASVVLIWIAMLPLGLGISGVAYGVLQELRDRA